ncbi:MAG TPA: Gfo/Idh/MocA family oxidoreductase [Bacteroidota bacterium]|nr:Gfo/Idh/MocA family oxidoreductase [Bacteroidota bacterium]
MKKVRWGILSTARIGMDKVIPAMLEGVHTEIRAIASSDIVKAARCAEKLSIPNYYGSYAELLSDPEIDAVYIPLPNHLHVEWTMKSLEAGKHVLCEKPIALNAHIGEELVRAQRQYPHLRIMEAFMYKFHPQWKSIRALIDEGAIGEVKYVESRFTYYNTNPDDIRNQREIGGGGLLDIGCYCISLARFIFNDEPRRVFGSIERDAETKIDSLTSGILEFAQGRSTFTCSTQLAPSQHATIFGAKGRIEIDIPFTPFPDNVATVTCHNASGARKIEFERFNQYTMQGDEFSLSILNNTPAPVPISDAVANMRVIDAVFESAEEQRWITLPKNA